MDKHITVTLRQSDRCYQAFYWTLRHILEQSAEAVSPQPFSLCDLLSNMSPYTFRDGGSADPAAYEAYQTLLQAETAQAPLCGYLAGTAFLRMYMDEYGYQLEDTLRAFTAEDYAFAFESLTADQRI